MALGADTRLLSPFFSVFLFCVALCTFPTTSDALSIVLAGGTGPVGSYLAPQLQGHSVTVLTRNAFLAAAPSRVTSDFGWLGESFLRKCPHVKLRDWDGGDLLDIVGRDWIGWQDDIEGADCIVHLSGGGFTEQRVMACERLVRETYQASNMHHIIVNPTDDLLAKLSPVAVSMKQKRVQRCEEMIKTNCYQYTCLRSDKKLAKDVAEEVLAAIREVASTS